MSQESSRYGLAAFMTAAGVSHFAVPKFYERIVPKWVGHEEAVVRWSGVAEVVCGGLVAVPRTKRLGAWLSVIVLNGLITLPLSLAGILNIQQGLTIGTFVIAALAITGAAVIGRPGPSLWGAAIIVAGIPLYLILRYRGLKA